MKNIDMTRKELENYMATEIAYFCRDKMFELNDHPMDYDDHFDYIIALYKKWLKEQDY